MLGGAIAGCAVALAAPVAASAARGGDAELIRLLGEFDDLENQWLSQFPGGSAAIIDDDARDAAAAPILERQDAIVASIAKMRAKTVPGLVALIRSLKLWDEHIGEPEDGGNPAQVFTAMITRDAGGVT